MGSQLSRDGSVAPSTFASAATAPMLVISLENLRTFGRVPQCKEAEEASLLQKCSDIDREGAIIVHVTHHSLQPCKLDSNPQIFDMIIQGVDAMVGAFSSPVEAFLWIAPVSLHNQTEKPGQCTEEIAALPYFMSQCDVLFTPVLDAGGEDERFKNWVSVDNQSSDWNQTKNEGWCRLDFVLGANIPRSVSSDHYFERAGYQATSSTAVELLTEDQTEVAQLMNFVESIDEEEEYEVIVGNPHSHTSRRQKVAGRALKKKGCWESRPHLLFGPVDGGHLICLPPFRNIFIGAGHQPQKGRCSKEDKQQIKRIMKQIVPLVQHRVEGYFGDIKGGSPDGRGTKVYKSGGLYHGRYQSGKMSGRGVFESADGSSYEGSWANNRQNGKGIMRYRNGDWYIGEWAKGHREGKGVLVLANGTRYEGDWEKDKTCGTGTISWASGESYDGDFRAGELHGEGMLANFDFVAKEYREGVRTQLYFEHGELVQMKDENGNAIDVSLLDHPILKRPTPTQVPRTLTPIESGGDA